MTQIYLAGPFFSEEQINRIELVEAALKSNPTVTTFFSPRTEEVRGETVGSPSWATKIYTQDIQALKQADVVVAMVDFEGDGVDSGTAFEIGYAVQSEIPVIVLQTQAETLNLMIGESLHYYTRSISAIQEYDFHALPVQRYQGPTF